MCFLIARTASGWGLGRRTVRRDLQTWGWDHRRQGVHDLCAGVCRPHEHHRESCLEFRCVVLRRGPDAALLGLYVLTNRPFIHRILGHSPWDIQWYRIVCILCP